MTDRQACTARLFDNRPTTTRLPAWLITNGGARGSSAIAETDKDTMLCLARGKPHEGGTNASFLPACHGRCCIRVRPTDRWTAETSMTKPSPRPHLCLSVVLGPMPVAQN